MRHVWLFTAALVALGAGATAHAGTIRVGEAWSRALPPVSPNGAAYLSLTNTGHAADELLGARTAIAARAEVHEHVMEGDLMRMREAGPIPLPPGETVHMAPGGLHLMLMDLKTPLREGERYTVTLEFREAPPLDVEVIVHGPGGAPARHPDAHGTGHEDHGARHKSH